MTNHLALMIRASAREYADKTAMRHEVGDAWHSITYAELGARIRTAAKALRELGIRQGDRVGIASLRTNGSRSSRYSTTTSPRRPASSRPAIVTKYAEIIDEMYRG